MIVITNKPAGKYVLRFPENTATFSEATICEPVITNENHISGNNFFKELSFEGTHTIFKTKIITELKADNP